MTLDQEDIEAIAQRVAHVIAVANPSPHRLLEPKELASALNVSIYYVYEHAVDLGVMRLGDGPKARMRFDLQTARRAMQARRERGRVIRERSRTTRR
ncbi:MAG: hypothetical protein ACRDK4_03670 [Solirubrobacteraceae bacterium]